MSDMNMKELERKLKAIRVEASSELEARVAASFAQAGRGASGMGDEEMTAEAADGLQFARLEGLWRLRKWALRAVGTIAAACVALAAMMFLSRGPATGTNAYAALAQVLETSMNAEWVHMRYNIRGMESETWTSFKPYRTFTKGKGGVAYYDAAEGRQYIYRDATNTVTVNDYEMPTDFDQDATNLLDAYQGIMKKAEARGAEVKRARETIDGTEYDVFSVPEEGSDQIMKILVNPKMGRIVRIGRFTQEGEAPSAWTMFMDVDYPEEGPADIYALGVPKEAKMVKGIAAQVKALADKVEEARAGFPQSYYAVVCHGILGPDGDVIPNMVKAVYKKNGRYRVETHGVMLEGEGYDPELFGKRCPPEDMTALEKWTKTGPLLTAFISDAKDPLKATWVNVGSDGGVEKRVMPFSACSDTVEAMTWTLVPVHESIGRRLGIAAERKGEFGALQGFEYTMEPMVGGGKVRTHPTEVLYYVNPERGYAVEYHEQTSDMQASWVGDKEWLRGVELEEKERNFKFAEVTKIVEYAQTPEGQWYARKLSEKREMTGQPRAIETITIVHLDTKREIPDDVFDINSINVGK